ncbi:MAG: DUF7474 family protein [Halobacteriota archaeon]
MGYFGFPCPGCGAGGAVHDPACDFADRDRDAIERAYIDVVAHLADAPVDEAALRTTVGRWTRLHAAALGRLRREGRVRREDDGTLVVTSGADQAERLIEPNVEPIRTLHRHGSVPGCHDNAVFAMIAWYEMVGLSWAETRERVLEWLERTGTWARGGFDEATPEQLVDNKRHVYEQGYGWREKAEAAKRVVERELNLDA